MQNHRMVAAATCATVCALFTSAAAVAQGQHAEQQYGGFVNAVWLESVPLATGVPGAFRVWTAEDGSRIQVYDSVTDTLEQMKVVSDAPQTLHDIYLDQHTQSDIEKIFGVAVGTGGEAVWWDSQGHSIWNPFVSPPAPGVELWACAVEHEPTSTTVWVCGEGTVLRSAQRPFTSWTDATWMSTPSTGATLTAMDFADWSLPNTRGLVGTDTSELFFTNNGTTWCAAQINDLPTLGPNEHVIFWDIDFRPGSATEAIALGGTAEGNGPGYAWRTLDGGVTWDRIYTESEATGATRIPQTTVLPGHPCTNVPGLVGGKFTNSAFATLYGVHMRQNGRAIMVAYGGQVWRYKPNLGYAVDISDTEAFSTGPLWGCHGDGKKEIWLSGQFGLLRRTSDGGRNFQAVTPDNSDRFRTLAFPARDIGYRGGQSMRLQRTDDGGETWTDQLAYESGVNLGPGIESLAAFNKHYVVAIANNFNGSERVAFVTRDGGASCWSEVPLGPFLGPHQHAVSLVDVAAGGIDSVTGSPTFYVTTTTVQASATTPSWSGLMRTRDGGATWGEMPTPASPQGADEFVWDGVAALGTSVVTIVGRNQTTGKMAAYVTLDADNPTPTWLNLFQNAPAGRLYGVAVNGATLMAVGSQGRVYELDAATTSLVPTQGSPGLTNEHLRRVKMGFDGTILWAYASGDGGVLLRSALTSGVWDVVHSRTTDDLTGLDLRVDAQGIDVWAIGRNRRWGDSTLIHVR